MRQRLIHFQDVRFALRYALAALAVRCLQQRMWRKVADLSVRVRASPHRRKRFGDVLGAASGEDVGEDAAEEMLRSYRASRHRARMIVAAERRRRGWNPEIEIVGREHLDNALGRGRGAILWFDAFLLDGIVGKRAIAEAGHRMWHVSGHAHGFSDSRFAHRFLNHRVIDTELRYLAGRIIVHNTTTMSATRRIVEVLDKNGVISLTNAPYYGAWITTPFGARALLPVSRTPLHLAVSRGVALLPVSVIELEPFARYRVTIAPAIDPPGPEDSDPIAAMAAAYAAYILPLAGAHAGQWHWPNVKLPGE